MSKLLAAAGTLVILVVVNWAIYDKENHLAEGRVVYLELAPVDPRSLIQGDYMALRFAIDNRIHSALRQRSGSDGSLPGVSEGYVIVQLDQDKVASFQRLDSGDTALAGNEMKLYYRVRDGRIKFATNAFFFQEGHADRYEPARYGRFRVNEKGEPLLVALYDENREALGEALP